MLCQPIFVGSETLFDSIEQWRMMPLLPILLVSDAETMLDDVHIKQQ